MYKTHEEKFTISFLDGYGEHECVVTFDFDPGSPAIDVQPSKDSDIKFRALQVNVAKEGDPPEILELLPLLRNEEAEEYMQGLVWERITESLDDGHDKYERPVEYME